MTDIHPCSHIWIDPADAPIARAPYAPWIGPRRREMTAGITYVCRYCGARCSPVELVTYPVTPAGELADGTGKLDHT